MDHDSLMREAKIITVTNLAWATGNDLLRVRQRHNSLDCDVCEEGILLDASMDELRGFAAQHADCTHD